MSVKKDLSASVVNSDSQKIHHAGKGLNIFYFGKGKGKTTAAMGLAARAAGAGMNVFVLQFVKAKRPKKGERLQSGEWPISSEISFFENVSANASRDNLDKSISPKSSEAVKPQKIGKIKCQQVGAGFVGILGDKKERSAHVQEAKHGLEVARKAIDSGKYDLVVLDEFVSALELNLISEKEILDIIKSKPKYLHLSYTGHDFFEKIVDASDLVSEIKMVKHPFYQGILARRGIDF